MKELLIFGAGGHSKVCIETAQSMGYKIKAAFDDDENKRGNKVVGISVIGGTRELLDNYPPNEYELFIAIGSNKARMEKYEFFKNEGYEFATLIHPFSFVSKTVKIGENVLIMPGVVVNSSTIISDNII